MVQFINLKTLNGRNIVFKSNNDNLKGKINRTIDSEQVEVIYHGKHGKLKSNIHFNSFIFC